MLDFKSFAIGLACGAGGTIMQHFTQSGSPYARMANLSMGGVLSALVMLFPSAQRGSALALILSYVLIGILILGALFLFGLTRLPSRLAPFSAPAVEKVGRLLLPILQTGAWVILKQACHLILAVSTVVLKLLFGVILLFVASFTAHSTRKLQLSPQLA